MSQFDSLGRYQASHKAWDHVGNIIPDVEHSEGTRPALELRPADWLPVQMFDKHYENWNVIMPGKAVALDPNGRAMPAEYGLTGASVVYTQSDVDQGVVDIATGAPVTAAKTVSLANLTGVRHASWTAATAGTGAITSGFLGRYGSDGDYADGSKKYPVGVAPYAALQWAGGDGFNPAQLRQHNYIMQHQIAVLCDYVLRLPLIPAQEANETVEKAVSGSNLVFGTRDTHTRAQAQANTTGRYNASTGSLPVLASHTVIALALDEQDLARQTSRTQLAMSSTDASDDLSGLLLSEKSSLAAITQAGDYMMDHAVGVIFLYSADGATLPTALSGAAGTVRLTYYRNGAAAGTVSKFASVLGPVKPGDFLKAGANSNLVPAAGGDDYKDILGQVLALETHPRDALDRVRTAYNPPLGTDSSGSMSNGVAGSASANMGHMDRMPGSATGGHPDLIHYAGAADTIVIVNLVSR